MISASLSGPWLLSPGAISGIDRLITHLDRAAYAPSVSADGLAGFDDRLPEVAPGVVHLQALGMLVTRTPWLPLPMPVTGYDLLTAQFTRAFADPSVKAILFEIDSPGGMVGGCPELAALIRTGGMETGKPVAAILSPQAYSAAYWLAAACCFISVPESGGCGNIGCISVRTTEARKLQAEGIDVAVTRSGPFKGLGNPLEPFSPDFLAEEQAAIDAMAAKFAADVAAYRGVPVQRITETGGAAFTGPGAVQRALGLGLVDEIAAPACAGRDFVEFVQSL